MSEWKIDIYANKNDAEPVRSEIIDAETESEAVEVLIDRLKGGDQRGDATPSD